METKEFNDITLICKDCGKNLSGHLVNKRSMMKRFY